MGLYKTILPNGKIVFFELTSPAERLDLLDKVNAEACEEHLAQPRNGPAPTCTVWQVKPVDGALQEVVVAELTLTLPREAPSPNEYEQELSELLKGIPDHFWAFIRDYAWRRGHSCGLDEVLNEARSLVAELKPAIEDYKRCLQKKRLRK